MMSTWIILALALPASLLLQSTADSASKTERDTKSDQELITFEITPISTPASSRSSSPRVVSAYEAAQKALQDPVPSRSASPVLAQRFEPASELEVLRRQMETYRKLQDPRSKK